jgi:PKD repeat protein
VTGGAGRLGGAPGRGTSATLAGVSRQDVAVQTDLTLPEAPTGGGVYFGLAAQRVGSSDYRATVRVQASGDVDLRLDRIVDSNETILGSVRLPGTYTPGTALTVRLETSGSAPTTLKAKVWAAGTAEPADWTLTRTDGTASLQRPGALRMETYTASNATRATVFQVDNLRAEPAGTVVAPPANTAPTAAFTSAVSGLAVSVDGSGSSDADGSVASYAWDFGNGVTGTGVTASHTYAAAGTYQVKLTVTDDDGATGTVTKPVTVAAPQPPAADTPLASDAFGRAVTGGWGSADVGGAWTIGGTVANAAVVDGAGQLTGAVGKSMRAALTGVSEEDVSTQVDVVLPELPTGGGTFVALGGRNVDASRYNAQLQFAADGTVELSLMSVVDWNERWLAGFRLPEKYTAGEALTVRLDISGSTLKAKVWTTGTEEPDWQVEATDSTAALQRAGGFHLYTYTSGSASRPSVVRFDDLWAGAAGEAPPVP